MMRSLFVKWKLWVLILAGLPFFTIAQSSTTTHHDSTTTIEYSEGLKHGWETHLTQTGKKKRIIRWKYGEKQEEELLHYFPNGRTKQHLHRTFGSKGTSCTFTAWHSNGRLKQTGHFFNYGQNELLEQRDGVWEYYSQQGKLLGKGYYQNGQLINGENIIFNRGQVAQIQQFENGLRQGWSRYFHDGKKVLEVQYENGNAIKSRKKNQEGKWEEDAILSEVRILSSRYIPDRAGAACLGKVIEYGTGDTLIGAGVKLESPVSRFTKGTGTRENGKFLIGMIPPVCTGYQPDMQGPTRKSSFL